MTLSFASGTSPPASLLTASSAIPKTSDRRRNSSPAGPKPLCNACGIRSRKKRRALLGLKTKHKKSKKTNNHNNGSNTSKLGDSLKRKLLGLGREVVVQRSSAEELRQRRKLGEEEQAAVLLKYFGELGEDCSKEVKEICLIAEKVQEN
ncbi:unnamed protein product [Camellia sinensis]